MSQPVVDTLQLCDALRRTGMEREQAEGVARALGDELGAHVVAQGDLQSGFLEVRGEIQSVDHRVDLARTELVGQIRILDGKVDSDRTELGGRIDALDGRIDALESKLTFMIAGVGPFVGAVTLANALGFFQPAAPIAQGPAGAMQAPAVVPSAVTPSPRSLPDG